MELHGPRTVYPLLATPLNHSWSFKNSCSSKNCTQFDTLPSDTLYTVETWHFILVHCNNFKKLLAQLRQHNPILRFTRFINSSISFSMTLCITKTSVTHGQKYAYPLTHPFVTAYGGSPKQNNNQSKHHITHCNSSTSHLSTSYRSRLTVNDVPTYVLVSTHIIPFSPIFLASQITHFTLLLV